MTQAPNFTLKTGLKKKNQDVDPANGAQQTANSQPSTILLKVIFYCLVVLLQKSWKLDPILLSDQKVIEPTIKLNSWQAQWKKKYKKCF